MSHTFKGNFLNFNYVFDIETSYPNQWVYDYLLKNKWKKLNALNYIGDYEFIFFALRFLPNGSFVIFFFDDSKNYFVQLGKFNNDLRMVMPLIEGNIYSENYKKIIDLLRQEKIRRFYKKKDSIVKSDSRYFITKGNTYGYRDINVSFGLDYFNATKITLLIAEKILDRQNLLLSYKSDKIQWDK